MAETRCTEPSRREHRPRDRPLPPGPLPRHDGEDREREVVDVVGGEHELVLARRPAGPAAAAGRTRKSRTSSSSAHVDVLGRQAPAQDVVGTRHELHPRALQVGVDVARRQVQRLPGVQAHLVQQGRDQDAGVAGVVPGEFHDALGGEVVGARRTPWPPPRRAGRRPRPAAVSSDRGRRPQRLRPRRARPGPRAARSNRSWSSPAAAPAAPGPPAAPRAAAGAAEARHRREGFQREEELRLVLGVLVQPLRGVAREPGRLLLGVAARRASRGRGAPAATAVPRRASTFSRNPRRSPSGARAPRNSSRGRGDALVQPRRPRRRRAHPGAPRSTAPPGAGRPARPPAAGGSALVDPHA